MDRSSPAVSAARLIQRLPLSFGRIFEVPITHLLNRRGDEPPMIVILALPRSGSTLLYQVLCHSLNVTYLSNLWNVFYQVPLLGGLASRWLCRNHVSNFQSVEGFIGGVCGPAEGRKFWQYWLGSDIDECRRQSRAVGELSDRRVRYLKSTLEVLVHRRKPLVTGYLGHLLVWSELVEIFPRAVFIRLRRDPLDTALSLLRCRMRRRSNDWFSVLPKECIPFQSEPVIQQVAAQVYWLNKRLEAAEPSALIEVDYGSLCSDPRRSIKDIIDRCCELGLNVSPRQEPPLHFEKAPMQESDDGKRAEILVAIRELERRFGPIGDA